MDSVDNLMTIQNKDDNTASMLIIIALKLEVQNNASTHMPQNSFTSVERIFTNMSATYCANINAGTWYNNRHSVDENYVKPSLQIYFRDWL